MSDAWQTSSKLVQKTEQRESSAEGDEVVARLLEQIAYLHCQLLNLSAEHSRLQDKHSKLSRDNDLLRTIIVLEEGESGGGDDGVDIYVASPLANSGSVH